MTTYAAPAGSDYYRYAKPKTTGLITPLILGRGDTDSFEPLDAMQAAVQSLGSGDSVYLSAWIFEPACLLTMGAYLSTNTTWGQLFAAKAGEGVIVRLLINDFDPIAGGLNAWELRNLAALDSLIGGIAASARDNLKYLVCRHPVTLGKLTSVSVGQGWRTLYPGAHHQKFMVVRHGEEFTAFCGGVDIEPGKTKDRWDANGWSWHDVHVKLEGPITRDLEQEFVMRWNLSQAARLRAPVAGWSGYDTLFLHKLSAVDSTPQKTVNDVQMLRTISKDNPIALFENTRHDIQDAYMAGISQATKFIYMENQYFRVTSLAGWLLQQAKAHPDLVIVIVVVADAGADDGSDPITELGDHLQFQTFQSIVVGIDPARLRIYTMNNRVVHAKLIIVDDTWMCVGSANVNPRGFTMDSELNIQTGAASVISSFRGRLWGHNLGVPAATAAGWSPADFITQWDAVATANARPAPNKPVGEAVMAYDYKSRPGKVHPMIDDRFTELDLSPDNSARWFGGDVPTAADANDAEPGNDDPTV